MNSGMIKPKKFGHLYLVYHFTVPLKEFLACNGCFQLFTKIEKGSWTSFWCTFSESVPCSVLFQLKKLQCHSFFPSQDVKQKCVMKFLFR